MLKHLTLATVLCTTTTLLSATDDCCSGYNLWGELLYVQPTCGSTDWAAKASIASTTDPSIAIPSGIGSRPYIIGGPVDFIWGLFGGTIDREAICPDYNLGFRIGLNYELGCRGRYARLSLTNVNFRDGSNIGSALLFPTLPFLFDALLYGTTVNPELPFDSQGQSSWGVAGSGRASLKLSYWDADLRGSQCISSECGLDLQAFVGLRYVKIDDTLSASLNGSSALIELAATPMARSLKQSRWRRFSGLGPTLGLGAMTDAWDCFFARCEVLGLAIIGSRKGSSKSDATEITLGGAAEDTVTYNYSQRFNSPSCTTVVPGVEARLSLGAELCWCGTAGMVEVGYTATHFWNVLAGFGIASPNLAATTKAPCDDFGFAGPFAHLELAF